MHARRRPSADDDRDSGDDHTAYAANYRGEIRCFHAASMLEAQATRESGHRSARPDTYR
jgi:hypothetical protein